MEQRKLGAVLEWPWEEIEEFVDRWSSRELAERICRLAAEPLRPAEVAVHRSRGQWIATLLRHEFDIGDNVTESS